MPESAPHSQPATPPDGLMVFDGICNVCSGTVRLVGALDRDGLICFTSIQSPYGRSLCRAQGVDPDDPSTFLFFADGKAHAATDGIAAMLRRLPRPWRWLVVFEAIPRRWRNAAYRWIARNRYRLFGKRRTCMMAPQTLRARFIDEEPMA